MKLIPLLFFPMLASCVGQIIKTPEGVQIVNAPLAGRGRIEYDPASGKIIMEANSERGAEIASDLLKKRALYGVGQATVKGISDVGAEAVRAIR